MHVVDRFLGQGVLPFVGREEELGRILGFWRGTAESQHLRLLLLTAEAGAGKSRLLEEAVGMIEGEGGVVIHAKLYPDGANDLASLLGQALRKKGNERELPGIRTSDGETPGGIILSLRRLSRLRPVLLVFEDIHLLPDEALPDLTSLLGRLSDETISVLACARPVQLHARSSLERSLVDTIEMKGLGPDEIASLWRELFSDEPKDGIAETLHRITFGNCLALRSALRALIQGNGVERRGDSAVWRTTMSQQELEHLVRQSVSLVVEGLVAQLTPEMRRDAARIAMLGEIFARESAEYLLGSSDRVERLQQTDLFLLSGHPAPPLAGRDPEASRFGTAGIYPASRSALLVFTHSLLHNYLINEAKAEPGLLCLLLARNLPLYSLAPVRLLGSVPVSEEVKGEVLVDALQRLFVIAQRFDRTSGWKEGQNVWETVRHLFGFLEGRIPPEEYRSVRIAFLTIQLSIWRRERGSERWLQTLEEGLRESENCGNREEAYARILLYAYWGEYHGRIDYHNTFIAEEGAREVLERFPEQRYGQAWAYHLEMIALIGVQVDDEERIARLQHEFDTLLADPALPPEVRSSLIRRLARLFLMFFSDKEELAGRIASMEIIEEEIEETNPFYGTSKSYFLMTIGRFAEGGDLAERLISVARDLGAWTNILMSAGIRAIVSAAAGTSLEVVARELKEGATTAARAGGIGEMSAMAANSFLHVLFFRGIDYPEQVLADTFGLEREQLTDQQIGLIGIWTHDLQSARRILNADHVNQLYVKSREIRVWKSRLDRGDGASFGELLGILEGEVLELRDILAIQGSIHLQLAMRGEGEEDRLFLQAARGGLERSLQWLVEHGARAFTTPLIGLLESIGEGEEAQRWRRVVEQGENSQTGEEEGEEEGIEPIRVSMLGTIRVALPGEDFAPLRGVRLRTLLGLMVADRMISRPLSADEFVRLAGGDDPDPEHARKKKNMGIVRLREMLGREAILTDGETPRLNDELVEVDLLRADEALRRGAAAVAEGALLRAHPWIGEALNIVAGEVPFPTLYDDFFEAVRDDFEHRLRTGLLELTGGLLEGGDTQRAEELLRRAFDLLPGDGEIGEALQNVLIASGNRVEAARVRMVTAS